MKIYYQEKFDDKLDETKRYIIEVARVNLPKNKQDIDNQNRGLMIISSTQDSNRAKLFNKVDFINLCKYYDKEREDKKRDLILTQE